MDVVKVETCRQAKDADGQKMPPQVLPRQQMPKRPKLCIR